MIFDDFRDLAADLMIEMAVPASLSRVTSAYDRVTDKTTKISTSVPCRAVLAPRKSWSGNGVLVVQTVATLTVEPKTGDKLVIGARTYTVESVEEIAPDSVAVVWKAVIR